MTEHHQKKKSFFASLGFVLLSVLIFIIIYSAIFYAAKGALQKSAAAVNMEIPTVKTGLTNPAETDGFFLKYAGFFGAGFGIIILILLLVLYGIAAIFKATKWSFVPGIIMILTYSLFFLMGLKLAFFEKSYAPWATGIIFYVGHPLFYATTAMLIISVASIFLAKRNAK